MKKLFFVWLMLTSQSAWAEDLLAIYRLAVLADPNTTMAKLRVEQGKARQGQAGGALLPQINASANLSLNDAYRSGSNAEDAYRGQRYNISLSQSVVDLPKYWDWKKHQELTKQLEAEYNDSSQSLMADVVERYFNVLEAKDNLFLVRQEKESTLKQLQQVTKQYKKQLNKITDVYEIEAKLDALVADEIEAETEYVVARETLSELTGQQHQLLYSLKQDVDYQPIEGDIQNWIDQAKNRNPAITAQDKSIDAAKNDLAQQKSRRLPVVDIQLNYYISNTGFQNSETPRTETQVAAVNVNLPIFTGGSTTRRIDEAAYGLEISKQERIASMRKIVKDTRDFYLSSNASLKRIKAAQKALESSTKSREAMEKGFKYGVQTINDVVLSQAREFRAKRDLLQARYTYIKNRLFFERLVGGINEEWLITVNNWLEKEAAEQ